MMDGFAVMLRKELLEALRSQRLLVVSVVFLLLGIISPVGAKYLPELLQSIGAGQQGVQIIVATPTVNDAIAQFLKNVAGTGVFVALLLPMGAVAREKEQGTASFVLTKPVSRQAFLAAKALALFFVLSAGVALATVAAYFYTALLFHPVSGGDFLGCALLILLSLLVFASFTFLGSALTQAPLAAVGIGATAWVVLSLLGILPNVGEYMPAGLVTAAGEVALGKSPDHLALTVLVNMVLILVALAASWLAFSRQELYARA
jgi:ABC-2 type transport system permease protein